MNDMTGSIRSGEMEAPYEADSAERMVAMRPPGDRDIAPVPGSQPEATGAGPIDFASMPQFTPEPAVLEDNHVVAFDSRDMRSRPFNLMRTRFTKQLELQKMRLVGITSPAPTTGKSLLSVNLAAAIARLKDVPVILADLDLRRGSVADTLGLTFEHGVTDYLEGRAERIEDMLVAVAGLPLAILPSRVAAGDSSVLLSGSRYTQLMSWLRAQAQHAVVIVDLPPVFANDDTMILMESLDGYLMVAESGKTTARQVRTAMDLLKPAMPLGSVLNRYKGGVLDSYGYSAGGAAYNRYYDR